MKIELRKLSDIKPYPGNPRQNDAAVDAVAASIKEFGFRQPIVVDTDGVIICGHTRYKAAQKLGFEKVPVHVAKDLSPEKIRAYRIADNKTADLALWDYELLPIELSALQGMDFDLELLGFSKDDLAKIFDPGVKEGLTDPDDVPEPPDEAITQPGDLWILGDHRLLCGDSSKPEDVDRLLAETLAFFPPLGFLAPVAAPSPPTAARNLAGDLMRTFLPVARFVPSQPP
jgi:ParB-like chromosome segregation protein Spo0J